MPYDRKQKLTVGEDLHRHCNNEVFVSKSVEFSTLSCIHDANWCLSCFTTYMHMMPIGVYRIIIISEESESVVKTNIFHSLSGNEIGVTGGIAIGNALKECRLLKELKYV